MTTATYTQADQSIAAYDAFVFSAFVGRTFDASKADGLAITAWVDCEVASRDRTVNQCTRDHYRAQAATMRSIL